MDDFRRRPVNKAASVNPEPVRTNSPATEQPLPSVQAQPPTPVVLGLDVPADTPQSVAPTPPKKSRRKLLAWIIAALAVIVLAISGVWVWYQFQLSAVNSTDTNKVLVKIESGSTPAAIASQLQDEGLVRSASAFQWYARINGVQNQLQAGSYRLSPSESTPQIIEHLAKGKVDTFIITFLPGATLADNRTVLINTGYTEEEVDVALAKSYESPLFQDKPANRDLEGYIYGETYTFGTDTSVEAILEYTFEQYYAVIEQNDIIAKLKTQGLNLFEGITLASIVQREASPGGSDMADIAQVFYNRLDQGMVLGSDVTYQYIADKLGVDRDVNLDSPYNTRVKQGLPPGPIAVPGEKALIAVANPSGNDYLFFLSGDDDITYYAKTLEGHEANITNHCQKKCQII